MIILSFDQGLSHMGWAVIESCKGKDDKSKLKLLDYDCFMAGKKETSLSLPDRLYLCEERVEKLFNKFQPNVVTSERLFFSSPAAGQRNKSSAIMNTNMVTGVIMAVCGKNKVSYHNFSPPAVKKTICGDGRAKKEDVIAKIKQDYSIVCTKSKEEHICDAVAIGITYLLKEEK